MLADKDRIFTNVYGFQPWNIDAAIMRGDWDNTKDLMALGQDAQGSRPAPNGRLCRRSRSPIGRTSLS
jgi:hypothetical protein